MNDSYRERLARLQEMLQDVVAQGRAYEGLFRGTGRVELALAALRTLAEQARNELSDLCREMARAQQDSRGEMASPFTAREAEVLTLVARGLANKQIAHRLNISDRTVQFHVKALFDKTGGQSRTEAVVIAIERGWLPVST